MAERSQVAGKGQEQIHLHSKAGTRLVADLTRILEDRNVGYDSRPAIETLVAEGIASVEHEAIDAGAEWKEGD